MGAQAGNPMHGSWVSRGSVCGLLFDFDRCRWIQRNLPFARFLTSASCRISTWTSLPRIAMTFSGISSRSMARSMWEWSAPSIPTGPELCGTLAKFSRFRRMRWNGFGQPIRIHPCGSGGRSFWPLRRAEALRGNEGSIKFLFEMCARIAGSRATSARIRAESSSAARRSPRLRLFSLRARNHPDMGAG